MRVAGNPKRIVADLCVVLVVAATGWYVWLREPRTESLKGVESVELSLRYLWDPGSLQLQEWQVLGSPWDILLGPYGELFISDVYQAKVLRCATNGEFIEVIGGQGGGPGEFRECWDLGYCSSDSTLWVVDRGSISRFKLQRSSSQYIDRFVVPNARLHAYPNLVVQDAHTFWLHDRSRSTDKRILRINDEGEVITSFGEKHLGSVANSWGFPELLGQDMLVFVYMSRHIMELWNTSGELLGQKEFDLPEIRSITQRVEQLRKESQNPMTEVVPAYFRTAIWHSPSSAVYVMTVDFARNQPVIYAVDPQGFQILGRYPIVLDFEEHILNGLAVDETSTGVRFFSIDGSSGGVVVLEPAQ
jgi:hypothetical protein